MTPPLESPTELRIDNLGERGAGEHRTPLRRVRLFSLAVYLLIVAAYIFRGDWQALIGLTCSAAIVMINFLWLEEIVTQVLQPTPRLKAWRLTVRTLARFALVGLALSIAIGFARFDALSVLFGFSVLVAGILSEAVYSTYLSFKS